MKDPDRIVYTLDEVCYIFRLSKRKLRDLINSGEIKSIQFGPRHIVIPRSEVERWLGQDMRYVDLQGLGKPVIPPRLEKRLKRGGK